MTTAIPATTASAPAVTAKMTFRRFPRRPLPDGPDATAGKGAVEESDAYQGPDELLLPPESLVTSSTVLTVQFRGKYICSPPPATLEASAPAVSTEARMARPALDSGRQPRSAPLHISRRRCEAPAAARAQPVAAEARCDKRLNSADSGSRARRAGLIVGRPRQESMAKGRVRRSEMAAQSGSIQAQSVGRVGAEAVPVSARERAEVGESPPVSDIAHRRLARRGGQQLAVYSIEFLR